MSLPLSKEFPRSLLLTIRIIKLILPSCFPKANAHLIIKIGNFSWDSIKPYQDNEKTSWKTSHTFEVSEISPMYIGVFYKSGFFSETEFCGCTVKTENFKGRKGIKYTEVGYDDQKAKMFWTFIIDEEKNHENLEMQKLINEVEAEREEIKYRKNRIRAKMLSIKEKRKACKDEIMNLVQNFKPILELCVEKDTSYDKQNVISHDQTFFYGQTYDLSETMCRNV
ncbi:hypothetical protein SteCoe_15138 [Stentor coeruleus]|uniref:C2 domain-containing protein n=1 Tax=Stentor coeruleus TaxID=5963 RepID=A0A1R2C4D9_9CILI|nr:hypothetical protein SteCoe_15138 [Stentor coeruleus]